MENKERDLIRSRLTCLLEHVHCTAEFLMFFHEKKILTLSEIQEIAGNKVDAEKASKFLMLIQTRTNGFAMLQEGLLKFKQSGALNVLAGREELNSEPTLQEIQNRIPNLSLGQTSAPSQKIYFDVIPAVVSFTGRTAELEQLHQIVLRNAGVERVSLVSKMTAVSGLGGIGKTQLAREYVRVNGKEFDRNVLWMNAESEKSLYDSFKRLASEKLNIPTKDRNAQMICSGVYKYFEGVKALFVFDNAEKKHWLKEFMPQIEDTNNLFFFITSREREWDRGVEILSLDGLSEDEAVDLIKKGIEVDANDLVQIESVRKLAQTLQCFPLALQQAIAYIYEQGRTSNYSADTYLQEFKIKQLELLAYQEENAIAPDVFSAATATTWSMTFDKIVQEPINGKLACLILNVVAYLGADNISRDLFYPLFLTNHWLSLKMLNIASYFGLVSNRRHLQPTVCSISKIDSAKKEQTNGAVRLLVRYSMLNGTESQNILSVHRLVQAVTQNQLSRDGMEERYLEIALQLLLQGNEKKEFPAENISHVLTVWRRAFAYKQLIKSYSWQVEIIILKIEEVGYHDEGIRFGKEALEKFKEVFGEHHLHCLYIQRRIGLILTAQGHAFKAVSVFQDILINANSIYGEDSEVFLATKEDLGNALILNGKYNEAVQILKEVFEKTKTIFGENHSSTLITEENYGAAMTAIGKLTESEKIFERIIKIYMEKEGENSAKVLNLQNTLYLIYSKKGNTEHTLEIFREVYEKLSPVWAEDVAFFAVVCCNLGFSLNAVGEHDKALQILEGNIEKIKDRLGSQHLSTLKMQQLIGASYRCLGNYRKALDILQSVYQGFVFLSEEDSLKALLASREIATTLSRFGQHTKALSRFREIIPKMETLVGEDNLDVINTKWSFALAIEASAENLHTALDLLKISKALMIPIVGEDSPKVEQITNDIERIEKKIETK